MPVTYSEAPEVREVAQELIQIHHSHLSGQRIEYVFRSEPAKDKGKEVWGKARKIGGLNAFLADADPDAPCPSGGRSGSCWWGRWGC